MDKIHLNIELSNPNLKKHDTNELKRLVISIDNEIENYPKSKNIFLKQMKDYIISIINIRKNKKIEEYI